MNRRQAITKLTKLLGKNFAWREDPRALAGEEREVAIADAKVKREAKVAARDALSARQRALLAGDAEYQRLRAELDAAEKASALANDRAFSRRITVGTSSSVGGLGFFSVAADADNWSDAVEAVEAKRGAKASS